MNNKQLRKITKRHLTNKEVAFIKNFESIFNRALRPLEQLAIKEAEEYMSNEEYLNDEYVMSLLSSVDEEGRDDAIDEIKYQIYNETLELSLDQEIMFNSSSKLSKLQDKLFMLNEHARRCKKCDLRVGIRI